MLIYGKNVLFGMMVSWVEYSLDHDSISLIVAFGVYTVCMLSGDVASKRYEIFEGAQMGF